jgi:thiol-disulfide isomerase/thioredoxin
MQDNERIESSELLISRPKSWEHPGRRRLPVLAAVVLVVVALIAAYTALFGKSKAAPEVTFKTLSGEHLTTQQLRGKVVLVNFWATSCVTCVKEMPMLVETHQKYAPQGYETIAVAMNYDRPDFVLNFAQTRGLPFKVAYDVDNSVAPAFFDTRVTPTTFLIDKQGRIIKRYVGEPPKLELHALIEKYLRR